MVPPGVPIARRYPWLCGIVRTLREQTWNLSLEPARFVRSAVDGSREELKSLRVWLVEWTQSLRLGDPVGLGGPAAGQPDAGLRPADRPRPELDYFAPEALA